MSNDKETKSEFELNLAAFDLENILNPKDQVEDEVEDAVDESAEVEEEVSDASTETDESDDSEKENKKEVKDEKNDNTASDEEDDFSPFYSLLHEKLGLETTEDFKPANTVDGLIDHLGEIVEGYKESVVEDIRGLGDGIVGDLYDYLKNGGTLDTFKKTYFDSPDYSKIQIEGEDNESNQITVIEDLLLKEDTDPEDIKEILKDYKDSGILEKQAKIALKKLSKIDEQERKNLLKAQEEANEKNRINKENYINSIKETLEKSENIDGISISKEEGKKIFEYGFKPGKDGLTEYQRKIQSDKQHPLKLLIMSYRNFTNKDIESKVKTDITKQIKKNISRFTDTVSKAIEKNQEVETEVTNKRADLSKFKLPHLQ